LGLGGLFLWLYPGRASNQLSLLFGQIVGVSRNDAWLLAGCAAGVLLVVALVWRPLLFTSVDADVARARGVPVRGLSVLFAVLVGVATGLAVPTVGALLVLSLLITPAAAAARVTANPVTALLLTTLFAEVAVLGGIVASLAPGAPISGYVTAIAFVIYLTCRAIGAMRLHRIGRIHPTPAHGQ
ncbi:MAG: metal ABC transporter permease, partial [Actinomycetota bacterium]|nr:metal ABC transporter permease [Actinomycetota bacterium]